MKTLDKHIIRHIVVPSAMTFAVVSFLAVASRIREHYDDMPAEILTMWDMARLFAYFAPVLAVYILPITLLVGVIWAMGQMAQQDELTAIKAGGISMKRLSMPIVIAGGIVTLLCFWIQNYVQPWGITRAYAFIYMEAHKRMTLDNFSPGEMHDFRGMRIYFEDKDPEDFRLIGVDIFLPEGDDVSMYHADSAKLLYEEGQYTLLLEGVDLIRGFENNTGIMTSASNSIPLPPPPTARSTSDSRYAMSIAELYREAGVLRADYGENPTQRTKHQLINIQQELAERLSLPFTAVSIAIICAPLSLRARRKGRTAGFANGVVVLLVYFVLVNILEPQSLNTLPEVVFRAWVPNIVLICSGLALLYRADRI